MKKTEGTQAIITAAIRFAAKAHAETVQALIEGGVNGSALHNEPGKAWARALPPLVNRVAVQAYIACIADGMACGYVHSVDAKNMLYTAQLALAGFSGGTQ